MPTVLDLRDQVDLGGRQLVDTEIGAADELTNGASLVRGQAAMPVVLARGVALCADRRICAPSTAALVQGSVMTLVIDFVSAHATHKLLRDRRSVRYYQQEIPNTAIIERILVSAGSAPSAHNRQPWRYQVITDPAVRADLAKVMGSRLAADRRHDGDAEAIIGADVSRSYQRITNAPVVIVVALTQADMDLYPDERRRRAEYVMAIQSTAMATQNLLLAAHAEGLGACWMCAPLFCPEDVRSVLAMPKDWEPQALITLGYPARSGKPKPRRPLEDFVSFS